MLDIVRFLLNLAIMYQLKIKITFTKLVNQFLENKPKIKQIQTPVINVLHSFFPYQNEIQYDDKLEKLNVMHINCISQ